MISLPRLLPSPFLILNNRWLKSIICQLYLQEPFILTILRIKYFTFLLFDDSLFTLSKNFKEWDLAGAVEEFGFDVEDVDCEEAFF